MNFTPVIHLQFVIFTLFLGGAILRKLNIITPENRKSLSDLLIYFILPCNILSSFFIDMTMDVLVSSAVVLGLALAIQILSYALGKVLYIKTEERKRKVLQYATICSNAGFMGNQIIQGIYGTQALLYASIYLIPLRIFIWSAGLSCFTVTTAKDIVRKLIRHPCIISVFVGFIIMFMPFSLPSFLQDSVNYVSDCTLPVSMIIIGSILAEVNFKKILNKLNLYFTFIRLLLIPLLTLGICRLLHLDALVTGVCVVLAGMPAGSTTAILAEKYDGDSKFASETIFLSTLLSLVTVPVLYGLIGLVG